MDTRKSCLTAFAFVCAGVPMAASLADDKAPAAAITSDGTFHAPAHVPLTRPDFSAQAGKAEEVHIAAAEPESASSFTLDCLLACAGIAAVATIASAWRLSVIRKPDGTTVRGMTLGAKLALATGGLTTTVMGVAASDSYASLQSTNAAALAEQLGARAMAAEATTADLSKVRMNNRSFRLLHTDASLQTYADSSATLRKQIEALDRSLTNAEDRAAVERVQNDARKYDEFFAEVVHGLDLHESIGNSQMTAAGERSTALLNEVIRTHGIDADAHAAHGEDEDEVREAIRLLKNNDIVGQVGIEFQNARALFFKYFDQHKPEILAKAFDLAANAKGTATQLVANIKNPARKAMMAEVAQILDFWISCAKRVETAEKDANTAITAQNAVADEFVTLTNQIAQRSQKDSATATQAAKQTAAVSQRIALIVSASALFAAGLTSFVLVRGVRRSAAALMHALGAVASNDLTVKPIGATGNDELAALSRATDSMAHHLREAIQQVTETSHQVAAASTQIAASSTEIAASLQSQQEQSSQVSAAVTELSATAAEVSQKTGDAANGSAESGKRANEGSTIVAGSVRQMESISQQVNEASRVVAELGHKSEQIGKIVGVITEIADQTNLLALNAAIEAARAGEHGRGFAVVADEVRKLAERTTKATEEVSRSVREVQDETKSAVVRIEESTQGVTQGVEMVNQAGVALKSIEQSSVGVREMIQAIAQASEQQASASEQIARSMETISTATRQSTEGANQAAKAAEILSTQAESLRSFIARFKV